MTLECSNCQTRLPSAVFFCPRCGDPFLEITDEDGRCLLTLRDRGGALEALPIYQIRDGQIEPLAVPPGGARSYLRDKPLLARLLEAYRLGDVRRVDGERQPALVFEAL